ncbi:MAG: hypothetical protein ACTS73_04450 [Arsenophonus sp. NEOnobi-MAG3]
MAKIFSEMQHQRCWVHKITNVLASLKGMQLKVKAELPIIGLPRKELRSMPLITPLMFC